MTTPDIQLRIAGRRDCEVVALVEDLVTTLDKFKVPAAVGR